MNSADTHESALPYFKAHGFTYEYPGFFMTHIGPDVDLTCAFDWSGSGKWEIQVSRSDGGGAVDGVDAPDVSTPAAVVAYRDLLIQSGRFK